MLFCNILIYQSYEPIIMLPAAVLVACYIMPHLYGFGLKDMGHGEEAKHLEKNTK